MDKNHPLLRLSRICQPTPLRGEAFQAMAVTRDDLPEAIRPDLLIEELLLMSDDEPPKILLFGSRGCGKSTELSRVEQRFREQYLVVGLSVTDNQVAMAALSPEELIVLMALAVARAGREIWGLDLDEEVQQLDAAMAPLQEQSSQVKLKASRLLESLVLFGSTVLDPSGTTGTVVKSLVDVTRSSLSWEVNLGGLMSRARTRQEERSLLDAANALINAVAQGGGRRPLLLIDELDKIEDLGHSFSLFTDRGLIASLGCPCVITAPSNLLHATQQRHLPHFYEETVTLYQVRCWRHDAPDLPDEEGMQKLRAVIHQRLLQVTDEPRTLLSEAAETLLIHQCGGVIRDLVRLLHLSARRAALDRAPDISIKHVHWAIKRHRQVFEHALNSARLDCLREVARERMIPDSQTAYELLHDNFILNYHGERTWYYPHSILLSYLEEA